MRALILVLALAACAQQPKPTLLETDDIARRNIPPGCELVRAVREGDSVKFLYRCEFGA